MAEKSISGVPISWVIYPWIVKNCCFEAISFTSGVYSIKIHIHLFLQQKAEQMLSAINNQVQTLPSADAIPAPGFVAIETMTDLRQRQSQARIDMSHAYVPR